MYPFLLAKVLQDFLYLLENVNSSSGEVVDNKVAVVIVPKLLMAKLDGVPHSPTVTVVSIIFMAALP